MKKIIFASLLVSSCISIPSFADIKMDMLNDKVTRLENDVNAIQRKIYTNTVDTSITSSETIPQGSGIEDLYNKINAQDAVIKDLTQKMEQIEFKQNQLEEKLTKLNADLDVRFNLLEKTPVKEEAPAKPSSKDIAQKDYDEAYALMKKGKYKEAEQAFTKFMKDHTKSTLVGNANYWLGETYYARGLYEQAVGVFADGFTKYKNNSKAADNLLKLGLTMNKLNKKTEACTAFKTLPTEFPKADPALKNRAKAEAKKLSCK